MFVCEERGSPWEIIMRTLIIIIMIIIILLLLTGMLECVDMFVLNVSLPVKLH